MSTVVIAYDTFGDVAVEQEILSPVGAVIIQTHNLTSPEALETVRTADALMVTIQQVTADIIARMAQCKIICRVGTGLDAIDIPAATQHGVWVTNVPDYAVDEVATHTIATVLMHARRLLPMFDSVKGGTWWKPERIGIAHRITTQTLGIIGYGRIGQTVVAKARGVGLDVLVYDPYVQTQGNHPETHFVTLETLLRHADYITLHAPLTDSTQRIINADTLAQMKPTAFLINTARGQLIDEAALVDAVRSGKIAGAALDVLTVEPPTADHPLMQEERILITPHAAWYSEEAKHEVRVKGAEDVARVLRGEPPLAPVNQPKM